MHLLDGPLQLLDPCLQLDVAFFQPLHGNHQYTGQVTAVDRGRSADSPHAILAEGGEEILRHRAAPVDCLEAGGLTQTQSSVTALLGPIQLMDVWSCLPLTPTIESLEALSSYSTVLSTGNPTGKVY